MSFIGNLLGTNTSAKDISKLQRTPELGLQSGSTQYFLGQSTPYQQAEQQALQQQQQFAQALQERAAGGGPSVSKAVAEEARQANLQNAMAIAASSRGVNPAMAQRQALQAQGLGGQAIAGQEQAGRIQEQLGAQSQYGQLLGGMRAQDINNALAYQQMGLGTAEANQRASIAAQQIAAGTAQANAQNTMGIIGGIAGAAGSVAGLGAGGGAAPATPAPTGGSGNIFGVGQGMFSQGGHVPGKPKVFGDDEANDTVPAMLSPGEIVIPRTKAKDPDKAKEFIDHLLANEKKPKDEDGYSKVVQAHKELQKQMAHLKRMQNKRA